jgi:hypothetical protein
MRYGLKKTPRFVSPPEKPMIPHLLCCQGFGVDDDSQTLDALQLQHPQLSLNQGLTIFLN